MTGDNSALAAAAVFRKLDNAANAFVEFNNWVADSANTPRPGDAVAERAYEAKTRMMFGRLVLSYDEAKQAYTEWTRPPAPRAQMSAASWAHEVLRNAGMALLTGILAATTTFFLAAGEEPDRRLVGAREGAGLDLYCTARQLAVSVFEGAVCSAEGAQRAVATVQGKDAELTAFVDWHLSRAKEIAFSYGFAWK